MDRTAATHSDHDELLIVRLFGGDVDDHERARALDLLGECEDCAALFADLGATADATAALPVPARPRDFTLTEADATRLRRQRRGLGVFSLLRRTRAIGGSLVAIGLVGLVATSSLGILGGTAGTFGYHSDSNGTANELSAATAAPAALAAGQAAGSSMPVVAPLVSGELDTASPTDTGSKAVPPASVPSGQWARDGAAGSPEQQAVTTSAAATTSAGLDARLVWFGGFGLLFLAGLGVLIVPLVRRRRTR
ncbi:MAG TPA: hypothetical protein VF371_03355 [Candidatus Limnocylindrales bacterium]